MDKDLSKFGYNKKWLEYGILSRGFFKMKIIDQSLSDHTGWEHYRFGAFNNWLKNRTSASNTDIVHYIELALNDTDKGMGESAILSLLGSLWLTDEQFELTKKHILNLSTDCSKEIMRSELLRELNFKVLSNELFNKCLSQGDSKVHMVLIGHISITKNMLIQISELGANKKVRNIARQSSKSSKAT